MKENGKKKIILTEEQVRMILIESVLDNLCKSIGTKLLRDKDGIPYIRQKVRLGRGSVRDWGEFIIKDAGPGMVEVINPNVLFSDDRIYQTRKYGDVNKELLKKTYAGLCNFITDKSNAMAREIGENIRYYSSYSVKPSLERDAGTKIPVWEDETGWGVNVLFYFFHRSRTASETAEKSVYRNKMDTVRRMDCAMEKMKDYFEENAETAEDFKDVCKTNTQGGNWIVEFLFDEPETINGMVDAASRTMGRKPLISTNPGNKTFIWRLS